MIICKLLTNGAVIRNDGSIVPCCNFTADKNWTQTINVNTIKTKKEYFNSELLSRLQENLKNGIQDDRCHQCWQMEESGTGSWRTICNAQVGDPPPEEDILLELRLGTVCNFRCYTCSPSNSSKIWQDWVKLKDTTIFPLPKLFEWTENPDALRLAMEFLKETKILSILGGEPLYNKNVWPLLDAIRERGSFKSVTIVTNGSFIPLEKLTNIPNLVLSFSIDAIGSTGEYVRFDSNWQIIKDNLERAIDSGIKVHTSTVISLYNLFALPNLFEYLESANPAYIHYTYVMVPDFMSISRLHPSLKDKAIKMLLDLCKNDKNHRLYHALAIVGTEYTEEKLSEFVEYTKRLDQIRGVNIIDHVPQYGPLFKS